VVEELAKQLFASGATGAVLDLLEGHVAYYPGATTLTHINMLAQVWGAGVPGGAGSRVGRAGRPVLPPPRRVLRAASLFHLPNTRPLTQPPPQNPTPPPPQMYIHGRYAAAPRLIAPYPTPTPPHPTPPHPTPPHPTPPHPTPPHPTPPHLTPPHPHPQMYIDLGRYDAAARLIARAEQLLVAPGEPLPIDLAVKAGGLRRAGGRGLVATGSGLRRHRARCGGVLDVVDAWQGAGVLARRRHSAAAAVNFHAFQPKRAAAAPRHGRAVRACRGAGNSSGQGVLRAPPRRRHRPWL
jgi:hypothetical protein